MKPSPEVVQSGGVLCPLYADDAGSLSHLGVKSLKKCLKSVIGWMRMNNLKCNPDRTVNDDGRPSGLANRGNACFK